MAVTGVLTLSGTLVGYPGGAFRNILETWTLVAGKGVVVYDLANGANSIAVPTGTTVVIITPPASNVQSLTITGAGFELGRTTATVLAWNVSPTLTLTTGGVITGVEIAFL